MKWLEAKGYGFKRISQGGQWYWTHRKLDCYRQGESQWDVLYAAFKHSEEQQKPEEALRERVLSLVMRGYSIGGYSQGQREKLYNNFVTDIMSLLSQHIKGRREAVVEKLRELRELRCSPYSLSSDKIADAIMGAIEEKSDG